MKFKVQKKQLPKEFTKRTRRWFAYIPLKLNTGFYVWLEYFYKDEIFVYTDTGMVTEEGSILGLCGGYLPPAYSWVTITRYQLSEKLKVNLQL